MRTFLFFRLEISKKNSNVPVSGLLLVEAVLAAVVIAVGLVFVSRGLSSQLAVLRAVEERETLTALASQRLAELEALRLSQLAIPPDVGGAFDPPFQTYQWSVSATPRDDLVDESQAPLAADVTIWVSETTRHGPVVSVSTVWPVGWVPPEWHAG